jgi:glycerophosphoryl diester phosphodiesterase
MVKIIGHRGAMGYEPEDTLLSLETALKLGVDMIEFDVQVCRTGEPVVIHDRRVNRTTNGKGYVARMTLDELRELDAGKGERIPLLEEALDLIGRRAKVNIEMKGRGTAEPVHGIIEDYVKNRGWEYDDFLVSSFKHKELERFRELNPDVRIGALIGYIPRSIKRIAERLDAFSVHPFIIYASKGFVERAHDRDLEVYVHVVNKPCYIERMKSVGVDGIFSNYPDRI